MIALCLTVKGTDDEAPLLEQCLKSIHKHVDGIFIQLNAPTGEKVSTKVRKVAEKYTRPENIQEIVWSGNFAQAKNANFAQVPKKYEWILWLDSDDTVWHPEKIRQVASITPKNIHGIYICYDYAHDEYGNTTVTHWNCRMVRNNGSYKWKSSFEDTEFAVHETLTAVRNVKNGSNNEFKVVHHADSDRANRSVARNIELLEKMLEKQRKDGKVDPRVLYYLGSHLFGVGQYEPVINLLTEYLQLSGWAEERSQAHVFIGLILKSYKRITQARTAFLMALGENPRNAHAMMELGKLEFENKRYTQALTWLEKADIKQEIHAIERFNHNFELYILIADCLTEIGGKRLDEALGWAQKALKLRPLDPEAIAARDKIEYLVEYKKDLRSAARLIRGLEKEQDKIPKLLDALPENLQDNQLVVAMRNKLLPKTVWPRKSIAIYCGQGALGIWGPWSLKEGIGGSEEAVIQLSRELTDLGWKVTVYATPGDRAGDHDGVDWRQYWEINPKDEFDVLISWRNPEFFEGDWTARKKYIWMHDVMEEAEFTPTILKNVTKVILLSKYHRSIFPNIPDDKIFLSANGIVPEDFEGVKCERNTNKVIYMSSHVRGLELLYLIWPEVKQAVPKATLDIYYGWESFVNILGDNPARMGWREKMIKWEKELDGVTDHGKISHKQIIKEIFKSGVWAYPCPFPEIYCITAIKAQAGGAVPVSSNFAALEETVQYGIKIPMKAVEEDATVAAWNTVDTERFKEALIDMLKNPKKQEAIREDMMKWARTQSWQKVAESWSRQMQ